MDDGERLLQAAPKAKMAERTCNQRASVLQHLNVNLPDMISGSAIGRVSFCAISALRAGGVFPSHMRLCLPVALPVQEYLRLLALYNALMQAITDKGTYTLSGLNRIHKSLVRPFVLAYEAFVVKINKGVSHCTEKQARKLISQTFPKLHLLLHMCDQLANMGHVWYWNTGRSLSRLTKGSGRSRAYVYLLVLVRLRAFLDLQAPGRCAFRTCTVALRAPLPA